MADSAPSTSTHALEDGTTPRPDPTTLTTDQLRREILSLRELMEAKLECQDEFIDMVREDLKARPAAIDDGIRHITELMVEKFKTTDERFNTQDQRFSGITIQFAERDTRSEREARDNKTAVDAAIIAQKEAVRLQTEASALATAKSEAATMKQTDQLVAQLTTSTNALDSKITDLKDRQQALLTAETKALTAEITNLKDGQSLVQTTLAAQAGAGVGRTEQKTETHSQNSWMLALIMAAFTVVAFVVGKVL